LYQFVTVTASPGIVVIRPAGEEGDIVDVSAANAALLASNVSTETKSTRFIGFSFSGLNDASVHSMHAAPGVLDAH
jgi:hypothetical protein